MTVEEVVKTLHTNAGNARAVAAGLLQDVHDVVGEGKELDEIKGCMRFSCITRKDVSGLASGGVIWADEDRLNPQKRGRSCLLSCHISTEMPACGVSQNVKRWTLAIQKECSIIFNATHPVGCHSSFQDYGVVNRRRNQKSPSALGRAGTLPLSASEIGTHNIAFLFDSLVAYQDGSRETSP